MKIQATNDNVWCIRKESEKERGGIAIPGIAQKKTHKADILSVGKLVSDNSIKVGGVAIFNKSAGLDIEEGGVMYTVLTQMDILGTV